MTVWLKQGVCGDPKREIRRAIGIVHSWAIARDEDVYIHSIRDGVHIAGSLHYDGYAFDFSHRHRKGVTAETNYDSLRQRLGPSYDLVIEDSHIHIEWDPK